MCNGLSCQYTATYPTHLTHTQCMHNISSMPLIPQSTSLLLACRLDGEQQAIIRVRALPPKLSISSLVSLESLYGTCAVVPAASRSASVEITCIQWQQPAWVASFRQGTDKLAWI
eukprot:GHRR01028499.1.p1 GENE.GHRR01028499.1~~GHRR01028499.1.p1  ORF type:complete len:115 (-),score=30.05 GHRR01028499.1:273-617(-)